MKRILATCCLALICFGCSAGTPCDGAQHPAACVRVLFIGNSFTYVNDLPGMFAKLAEAGGRRAEVDMAAPGGWTLAQHANSADSLGKIKSSKWNFVVLQEQSTIPAFGQIRRQEMYPAVRILIQNIRKAGASPLLFVTWARRDGWPEQGYRNYADMQVEIERGYAGVAQELNVPVAPVGNAWLDATRLSPPVELWQADGSHPSEPGTYLAAAVFYAVIFGQSPVGLTYIAQLPPGTALSLQTIAAETVLNGP